MFADALGHGHGRVSFPQVLVWIWNADQKSSVNRKIGGKNESESSIYPSWESASFNHTQATSSLMWIAIADLSWIIESRKTCRDGAQGKTFATLIIN